MPDELAYLDATELARRIRAHELSPVELLRALRERADTLNPELNALVTPIPEAEALARDAERAVAAGAELGPLHGVPFTIKDSLDTAGVRTARGSLLFADHVPERDATSVARLRAAGAIPLAKSNLPEFALWWETDNRLFGRTANPWNFERTAGGSSGGEAAALAAGLSPLGLGSDLGGSIRLPAHYCGIVGLKPTHGRVPLTGHWPEALLRFMHVGPLARSVRDVELALSLLGGPDGYDWHAVPVPPPVADTRERLRVGWSTASFGPVDAEVAAAVGAAAGALAAAGHEVEEVDLPGLSGRDANLLTMLLYGVEGGPYFDEVVGGRSDELSDVLRRRLSSRPDSLPDYVSAEAEVEGLRRDVTAFFRSYDLLLCQTGPVAAHAHELAELAVDGEVLPPRATMRATIPFDLTGSPALTLPFGWSSDGLPIGVQLVGRRFEEGTVFRAAYGLEEAAERRRPPLRPRAEP